MAISTLKRRSEFLRVRGGGRASLPVFVIEGKLRAPTPRVEAAVPVEATVSHAGVTHSEPGEQIAAGRCSKVADQPRFGFTVTKKIGNAVIRNRIRRRLRAAVAELSPGRAQAGFDYVIIAREAALDRPFIQLKTDLDTALGRVHDSRPRQPRRH